MTDAYTDGSDARVTPPAAPSTVTWSYRLYVIGAALAVIGIVVTLITLPTLLDQAVQGAQRGVQGTDTSNIDVEAVARGAATVAAVIGIVLAAAYAVLTFVFAGKLRLGRNWARIVLLVFAVLQLGGVGSAFGIGILQFLVFAAAAVLSFLPASNAWFRHFRAQRTPTV